MPKQPKLSYQIDEQRVIKLHNAGMSAHLIAKRFNCSVDRIRNLLMKYGLETNVAGIRASQLPSFPTCAGIRRVSRQGLED